MSIREQNIRTEKAMRDRTAERRSGRPVRVPPDKDKLARWQGDHAALLARLQETYSELWLQRDLDQKKGEGRRHRMVGQLIGEAVKHFGRMP